MSLQVNDPRSSGSRSKSPSGNTRDRSKSRDSRRRPSPSPSRSPAPARTVRIAHESDSADEDLRPKSRDTKSRRSSNYDLLDSGDEARRRRYRHSDSFRQKDRYYDSDTGEEDGEQRGRLTPEYARRAARRSPSRRSSMHDNYSGDSGSDDSLDDGLIYGHDYISRSPTSSSRRRSSARGSSSRLRVAENKNATDGGHPSYATPGGYAYANPAQYAYASPSATKSARYAGLPTSTASQSNWAPIPASEMPRYAQEPMPGAFPQEGPAPAQIYASTAPQYVNQVQQHLYSPQSSRTTHGSTPSASVYSHRRTSSGNASAKPIYANPAPFQYAQIGPDVKYGSKTSSIPYAFSATPQFSKPPPSEQQYVEIAPGKRTRGHSHSLSASSANNLSVGGLDPGRRPASPMLEPYKGTYQSISPMPSPILSSSKLDDDISDVDLLAPSDSGKRKKDRRKSKDQERKEKEKEKTGRSKRDRSSTRQDRHDSHDQNSRDQQAMVLVSPNSSGKKVSFYDPVPDALEMRDALSHSRNIDTKTLIYILPHLGSEDMLALRKEYKNHVKIQGKGINMAKHIRLKLGTSAFGKVCYATALGRWESEAYWANCYYQSSTSRRELLIESLTGRSNSEIAHIKNCFRDSRYMDSLERCMKAELKADKFRTAILLALEEKRQSERGPIDSGLVLDDVRELHRALTSREGGETAMIYIIVLRSDNHLREVLRTYEKRYRKNFAREMIAKSQNLVGETLAHILNGVINRPMRDALLLHQALRESRTGKERSELLISRLVRLHWEPRHLEMVKLEFRKRYGELLEEAIAEEVLSTTGGSDWGEFCIELARSSVSEV